MTALAADRAVPRRVASALSLPVAAGVRIYAGALVCVDTATGFAKPGATGTTLRGVGVARERVDNSTGAAGALSVGVERGCWRFFNSTSTDALSQADIGNPCYMVDDQTVAKTTGGSTRGIAGTVRDVDANGVWVEF